MKWLSSLFRRKPKAPAPEPVRIPPTLNHPLASTRRNDYLDSQGYYFPDVTPLKFEEDSCAASPSERSD